MHILTIDEVIKNQRKLAEEFRQFRNIGGVFKEKAKKQIREYDQIAEWLEDYKRLKSEKEQDIYEQAYRDGQDKGLSDGRFVGYNKAIDDFIYTLEYDFGTDDEVVIGMYDLRETAKQLKENIEKIC